MIKCVYRKFTRNVKYSTEMLGLQESRRITAYMLMGYVDNFPDKEEIRQECNHNPLKFHKKERQGVKL